MLNPESIIYAICTNKFIPEAPFATLSNKLLTLQNPSNATIKDYFIKEYLNKELIVLYKSVRSLKSTEKIFVALESFLNKREIKDIYNYFAFNTLSETVNNLLNLSLEKSIKLWMIYGSYKNNIIIIKREMEYSESLFDNKFSVENFIPKEIREMVLKGGKFIYFIRQFFPDKMIFDDVNYNFLNYGNIYHIFQKNYLIFNECFFKELKNEINLINKCIFIKNECFLNTYLTNRSEYPMELIEEESLVNLFNLNNDFTYELNFISIKIQCKYLRIFLSKSNLKELQMIFRIMLLIHYTRRKCNRVNSFIIEQFISAIHLNTSRLIFDVEGLITDLKERINYFLRTFLVLSNKFGLFLNLIESILQERDLSLVIDLISKEDLPIGLKIFFEEFKYKEYLKGNIN